MHPQRPVNARKGRRGDPAGRPAKKKSDASQQRTCVISRTLHPRACLLRFVLAPDGQIVPDLLGRLPGRGLYVYPERSHVAALLQRRRLWQKLGGTPIINPSPPPAPDMMISRVETGLAQLLAERLGLARKAGVVGFGTAGIEQALITCAPTDLLVLMARNTAIHTREKVRRLVKKHGLPHVMEILDRDTIGAACGRGPTAVLAVAGQTVALPIIQVATRWQTFVESEFPCTRAVGVPKPAEKIS